MRISNLQCFWRLGISGTVSIFIQVSEVKYKESVCMLVKNYQASLKLVQLPCNFFMIGLAGGAVVNIVPTKTCVSHKECLITLQHPRSSIWNPRWRYRSSVSNSVLLVNGPKNWWWTHKSIRNLWIMTLLFSFTKIISPHKLLWFC